MYPQKKTPPKLYIISHQGGENRKNKILLFQVFNYLSRKAGKLVNLLRLNLDFKYKEAEGEGESWYLF